MKVALINDFFDLRGGTERHILDAAALLKTVGIDTVYIGKEQVGSPVEVALFPEIFKFRPLQKFRLKAGLARLDAFLREAQVDLVHLVHIHNPYVTAYLAERWPTVRSIHTSYLFCVAGTRYLPHTQRVCQQRCGVFCLATHAAEGCIRYDRNRPYPLRHQIKKLWEISANHEADRLLQGVAVTSQFMKDLLLQHDYDETLINIIPPPLSEAMEAIVPLPFPEASTPTLVFAGRLIPEKGAFDVLQALLRMKTQARLVILGDGSERTFLENDVKTLGLSERVEFRGWVPPEESRLATREAWLTVFPSHWPEPFGFSGIEGFLNHRPAVAYNVGGIGEWLVDGQNGLMVEPANIQDLADALDTLLQDPSRCQAMGAWGNSYAREHFGRHRHLDLKVRFYEKAIQAFSARQATVQPGAI